MVGVPTRREQVAYAQHRGLSQRRSCTLLKVVRSALDYRSAKAVREALKEVASRDLATAMRELVRVTVDAHLVDPALHRIFADQVPRMGQLAKIEALQRETFLRVRAYLEERRNEIPVAGLDTATAICMTTVEALTHEFVIDKPDVLDGDRDRFIDEVTRLVVGYLRPAIHVQAR